MVRSRKKDQSEESCGLKELPCSIMYSLIGMYSCPDWSWVINRRNLEFGLRMGWA